MTPPQEHRAIGLLETLGAELAELRGENRAHHAAQDRRLLQLEANHDMLLSRQQAQGQQVGIVQTLVSRLPCERHARRISEALRRLGAEEVTGRIEVAQLVERRRLLAAAGRITLGVFSAIGLAATVVGVLAKLGVL